MSFVKEGYVYVPDDEEGVMSNARPGVRIALRERRAPWIVVDHSVSSIVVARWPGKLWHVIIVDATGIEQASAHARYTRAFEVSVLNEIPLPRLFGEQGKAVCSVITRACQLELSQVEMLGTARHPDAAKAYSRAWNNWLAKVGGTKSYEDENLAGTLAISAGGSQSPINHGLMVLYRAVSLRAEFLVGPPAFVVDDEGNKYLEPRWAAASDALLEAAMAFGAPMVSEIDRGIMGTAWHTVFNDPP